MATLSTQISRRFVLVLILSAACVSATKLKGKPNTALMGPEYPPPGGNYGGGVAAPAYYAPYVDAGYRYANEGYGPPLTLNTPFDAPAGFDEMQGSEGQFSELKNYCNPKLSVIQTKNIINFIPNFKNIKYQK